MKTQNTTTGAGNTTAAQTIKLPALFIDDHSERGCDTPEIIKTSGKCYVMRVDDPAMPELLNDAAYYGDESMSGRGGFDPCYASIINSARRLIAAYERQTGAVLDRHGRVRMIVK
jgi:hypothetical protein